MSFVFMKGKHFLIETENIDVPDVRSEPDIFEDYERLSSSFSSSSFHRCSSCTYISSFSYTCTTCSSTTYTSFSSAFSSSCSCSHICTSCRQGRKTHRCTSCKKTDPFVCLSPGNFDEEDLLQLKIVFKRNPQKNIALAKQFFRQNTEDPNKLSDYDYQVRKLYYQMSNR